MMIHNSQLETKMEYYTEHQTKLRCHNYYEMTVNKGLLPRHARTICVRLERA
jgi:hypothetical protein